MYKFTFIDDENGDTTEFTSSNDDMDIYEIEELFHRFLIACTFPEALVEQLKETEVKYQLTDKGKKYLEDNKD